MLIVCCLGRAGRARPGLAKMAGAPIYPTIRNMLLAPQASVWAPRPRPRHLLFEKEVDEILGLPDSAEARAILPIGNRWAASGREANPDGRRHVLQPLGTAASSISGVVEPISGHGCTLKAPD